MRKTKIIYTIMFVLTVLLLCLSALQSELKLFKVKPLSGVTNVPELKKFNFKNYYDLSFQKSLEKNIGANLGFKGPLIRMYNQYAYDLYDIRPNAGNVSQGKGNWLFPNWHLKAVPFSDELAARFNNNARYLSQLSNILKEYNTHVFVGFIPSKTEIYGEYLADHIKIDTSFNPINHYCGLFDEYGVDYINLTEMFKGAKGTAIFPPFSQTGTHWSNIMSVYSADTIFKILQDISGLNFPKLKISEPYADKTRDPDNDLESLYNLIRPFEQAQNYYVDVDIIEDSSTIHPKMIVIGDSHYWNCIYNLPLKKIFSENPYWYYSNTVYGSKKYKNVNQANVCEEFINSDCILVLYSSYQTYTFVQNLADFLIAICINSEEIDANIEKTITSMKSNKEWTQKLIDKSTKNNVSLEETMRNEALYLIKKNLYNYFPQLDVEGTPTCRSTEFLKTYDSIINKADYLSEENLSEEEQILLIMSNMRDNKDWMESLKQKAKSKNKPLEEVMRNNAKWIIEQRKKQ